MWHFDILPSPPSQAIQPRDPDNVNEELDSVLSPINLQEQTGCNCDLQPINPVCLVGIPVHRVLNEDDVMREREMEEIRELTQTLDVQDSITEDTNDSREGAGGLDDGNDGAGGLDDGNDGAGGLGGNDGADGLGGDDSGGCLGGDASGDHSDNREILYPEKFVVVGSWQEQRYQGALASCMWRRSTKLDLQFNVEPEPGNVKDKNALKFQIFHNNKWHVIGYCGVNKIPKLKRAMHRNEVRSISLETLKRTYAPREKALLYSAALLIVKSGPWDRDDPRNNYNSDIDL